MAFSRSNDPCEDCPCQTCLNFHDCANPCWTCDGSSNKQEDCPDYMPIMLFLNSDMNR